MTTLAGKHRDTYCPICHEAVRGLHYHMADEVLAARERIRQEMAEKESTP